MQRDEMQSEQTQNDQVKLVSGTNIVAGLWLLVAAFVLGYAGIAAALWNEILVGAAIAVLAWLRVSNPERMTGLSWTNAVLGVWLIAAPFVLGYAATAAAMWNEVIIGLVVAALGTWSAIATNQATGEATA